jgi:hypothetical protein
MNLSTAIVSGLLALAATWATWQLARMVRVWRRLSGARLVTCPATGRSAAVRIDAKHAAVSTLVAANPESRIADCSLWATCGLCDRGCMREALTRESALRNVLDHWYAQRKCVYCGKLIGTAQSSGHHAALLTPQGLTHEWSEVPANRMVDSLKTDRPVCWNCHVAETFRREYPDMVTDRPWPKNAGRRAG